MAINHKLSTYSIALYLTEGFESIISRKLFLKIYRNNFSFELRGLADDPFHQLDIIRNRDVCEVKLLLHSRIVSCRGNWAGAIFLAGFQSLYQSDYLLMDHGCTLIG